LCNNETEKKNSNSNKFYFSNTQLRSTKKRKTQPKVIVYNYTRVPKHSANKKESHKTTQKTNKIKRGMSKKKKKNEEGGEKKTQINVLKQRLR